MLRLYKSVRTLVLIAIGMLMIAFASTSSGFAHGQAPAKPNASSKNSQKSSISQAACRRISVPYRKAINAYNRVARAYWTKIARKKKTRRTKRRKNIKITRNDYILKHPPAYKGQRRPKCLAVKRRTPKRSRIGVVADFLKAAKRVYGFVPRSTTEKAYKKSYAEESLLLGLTADQIVGVYALETGGIGPYYRQSGIFPLNDKCQPIKPKGRAASTALGYAQLLAANSSAILIEKGKSFAKRLEFSALLSDDEAKKKQLNAKARIIRRMIGDIRRGIRRTKNRNNWREYVAFSKTARGYAVHALNLDADIGPLLQVYKLKKIVQVAAKKGFHRLSAAELELLNLVGYGRGMEMMTPAARDVPTSNFFSRQGYERNPVAKRLSAKGLLDKLDRIIAKRLKSCGSIEFANIFKQAAFELASDQ